MVQPYMHRTLNALACSPVDIRKGRWTQEEKQALERAVDQFGTEWSKVEWHDTHTLPR